MKRQGKMLDKYARMLVMAMLVSCSTILYLVMIH